MSVLDHFATQSVIKIYLCICVLSELPLHGYNNVSVGRQGESN